MPFQRFIGNEEISQANKELRRPEVEKNLNKVKIEDIHRCVVKLKFKFKGQTYSGTGFYVNLPSPDYHVILTAAHNLISTKGVKAEDLTIVGHDFAEEKAHLFTICPQYERDPGDQNGKYDYGVVLVQRKNNGEDDERHSFGLNLAFSSNRYLQNITMLSVCGFRDTDMELVQSEGKIGSGLSIGQISYHANTVQGMSGSPVWHGYDGFAAVVGIHNMCPQKEGRGSRGTQINEEVFYNICRWSNTGYLSKHLYVDGSKYNKEHRMYLTFTEHNDAAQVFLGKKEAAAQRDALTFDILPTYVFQTSYRRQPLDAFKFHRPPSWDKASMALGNQAPPQQWVEWQPNKQRAILVDSLKDANLIRMDPQPEKGTTGTHFKIKMLSEGKTMILMLHDKNTDKDDIDDGMNEVSGVFFGKESSKFSSVMLNRLDYKYGLIFVE